MEANKRRNIKSGSEYDQLFPGSENDTKAIRKNANVDHTVAFIPKVVQETLDQTRQISQILKGRTLYETCSNIWHFVYQHINYKKDQEGYEQIRSPSRAWHDRKTGVDCDCYSVFISSILTNLFIPHILRITKYHRDYFQHIYPVVPFQGKYITIDCVTDKFDYEVPFSEKKDYPMELQYLNGFDGDGMGELGRIFKKKMAKKSPLPVKTILATRTIPQVAKKAVPSFLQKLKGKKASKFLPVRQTGNPIVTPVSVGSPVPAVKKKKGVFKKVLNVVNKVNPATVLLRNGVLAAMKLNIKNVGKRLRWSYLTPEQANQKGIDPVKFQKLVQTRQKLENIFFGAGGKPDNLKKAILTGKGNKDKAVSGLGMLPMIEWAGYMSEYTPLSHLLGSEIYHSENVEGMEGFQGFGELGEPVTLATVGAAMGVIAGIVAALKQVGDIFKTKQKGSEDFDEAKTDAPEDNVAVPANNSTIISTTKAIEPTLNPVHQNMPIRNSASINNESDSNPEKIMAQGPIVKSTNYPVATMEKRSSAALVANNIDEDSLFPAVSDSTNNASPATSDVNNTGNNLSTDKQGFWEKNKSWLKPVAIGAGGLTLIAIGFKLMKGGRPPTKSSPGFQSLSGIPKRKKKKKNDHRRSKSKHQHKKAVALL